MINNIINLRSELGEFLASDLPEEIESMADLLVEIELTFEQMKRARDYLKQELSVRLADKDLQVMHSRTGNVRISRTNQTSRTQLKRESLINHLRANCSKELVDVKTGEKEVHFDEKKFMEIYLECFLPQPKWTPLKNHGVNDEDFCTVNIKTTVTYSGLKELKDELLQEIESSLEEDDYS